MKFTIERSALLRALNHAQSVVERRTTIPILNNILLTVGDDGLSLTATDLDLAIVETAACDVTQGGSTTAPAHTMYDIVRKLPDGAQVEFIHSPDDSRLMLRAGALRIRVVMFAERGFPGHVGRRPAAQILRQGGRVCALDRKNPLRHFDGRNPLLPERHFRACRQQRRRYSLARGSPPTVTAWRKREIELPAGADGIPGVIIPRKAVAEIHKLIDETDSDVEVSLSDTRVRFAVGGTVLTSKLIDGTFPDYQRVIPAGNDKVMEVDRETFARAVDRVSTISSEKSRAVKVLVGGDQITLSANSPDQGSASEDVPATYEGESLEIGFNSKYLLDITSQVDGDHAQFIMSDAASPTIIRDVADDGALYVLMPMRV